MNTTTQISELLPVLPEIALAVGAMLMLMLGVALGDRSARLVNGISILILIGIAVLIGLLPTGRQVLFDGSFVVDDFARFLKVLALTGTAGALLLSLDYLKAEQQQKFEYGALFLLSTLGMLMLISANDLIALYLGLELMSLALYVVAAFNRNDVKSAEAGLKYFVLGALSSGMLLYGASLVYGFTGTVSFAGIAIFPECYFFRAKHLGDRTPERQRESRMFPSTVMTPVPLTFRFSRLTVANPPSVNVTVYTPG